MTYQPGRHFLQVPGPTNIPDSVLRAIAQPVLDHRGPAFAKLAMDVLERIKPVFKTRQTVMIFPDRKSTRLNSSHIQKSRMPSSA